MLRIRIVIWVVYNKLIVENGMKRKRSAGWSVFKSCRWSDPSVPVRIGAEAKQWVSLFSVAVLSPHSQNLKIADFVARFTYASGGCPFNFLRDEIPQHCSRVARKTAPFRLFLIALQTGSTPHVPAAIFPFRKCVKSKIARPLGTASAAWSGVLNYANPS